MLYDNAPLELVKITEIIDVLLLPEADPPVEFVIWIVELVWLTNALPELVIVNDKAPPVEFVVKVTVALAPPSLFFTVIISLLL